MEAGAGTTSQSLRRVVDEKSRRLTKKSTTTTTTTATGSAQNSSFISDASSLPLSTPTASTNLFSSTRISRFNTRSSSVRYRTSYKSLRVQRSASSAPQPSRAAQGAQEGHGRLATQQNTTGILPDPHLSSVNNLDVNTRRNNVELKNNSNSPSQTTQHLHRHRYPTSLYNLHDITSDELVGAPLDAAKVMDRFDGSRAAALQASARRPPPPPLSHTAPADPKVASPSARTSGGYASGAEKHTRRISTNNIISPKRLSNNETRESKGAGMRKKSGFSGFMNGILNPPKKMTVGAPENPVHVTHVGYDNETGQFTVRFSAPKSSHVFQYSDVL